jgi:TorA maturation chaperone TorD
MTAAVAAESPTPLPPIEASRAEVYALLAALLSAPPNTEFLARLSELQVDEPDNTEKTMQMAWARLKLAASQARTEAVEQEFNALFIGLGRGELVPYSSWYLTGMLMDKPLAVLRTDLKRLGFARDAEVHEPEDHVAALCEVMSLLIYHPQEYSFETQRTFFITHLSPWLIRFFEDVHQANAAQFYRSVGYLGMQFGTLEQKAFAMLS